jgi:hypothetical protein
MGKRSGVPHTDAELARLTVGQLRDQIADARLRLGIERHARGVKQWKKRIHWLEAEIARRD